MKAQKVLFISIIILILGLSPGFIFAKDRIVKKSGDEIEARIIEINDVIIIYRDVGFLDPGLKRIKISDVKEIIYEDGRVEYFFSAKEPGTLNYSMNTVSGDSYKGNYIMIGTGLGMSYGIIGVRFQQRFGKNVGFGYHVGAGFLPGGPLANMAFSAGVKFFPYRNLYINSQFGIVGWEYQNDIKEDVNQLGVSFLTGGDWVWGSKIGFGLNFGIGITFHLTSEDYDVTPAGDLGFLIRF